MNKFKLFIENFLVYGLGGVISKIIPLIMVPIVTRMMPSSVFFGISDLSNAIVQIGSYLAIMGMYDAMYRMFFEKEEEAYKIKVCSTAFSFTLSSSIVVFLIVIIFRGLIARLFMKDVGYSYVVSLSAVTILVSTSYSILAAPTRMQNKRVVFLITNTISPILSYAVAIPLLLAGYYIVALPIAAAITGITMGTAFAIMNRKWFRLREFDASLLKQMLVFAIPLLPNFLIYWVFNSCDKVMITNMIGLGAEGIYAVGSKLGHASQLIYTAFAGGWQYFAFATMKEENQVESNSKVFEYLGTISFVATAFICAWSYGVYKVLFPETYLSGYIVAPYLFLAPLLQMLFQVAANQFLVVKKTWPNLFILTTGAVINIAINFLLIPVCGIEGAAVATMIGYIISDIICVLVLMRMKLMVVSNRFLLSCGIFVCFMITWRAFFKMSPVVGTLCACAFLACMLLLYIKDIKALLRGIKAAS